MSNGFSTDIVKVCPKLGLLTTKLFVKDLHRLKFQIEICEYRSQAIDIMEHIKNCIKITHAKFYLLDLPIPSSSTLTKLFRRFISSLLIGSSIVELKFII